MQVTGQVPVQVPAHPIKAGWNMLGMSLVVTGQRAYLLACLLACVGAQYGVVVSAPLKVKSGPVTGYAQQ